MTVRDLDAEVQTAAVHAILDVWAQQPYARSISARDHSGVGILAMVDGAIEALLNAGWTPPND